jgi:hypothetical protein
MRCSLVLLGLIAAGCAGGGGASDTSGDPYTAGETVRAIKVTYLKFSFDKRLRKWTPEYRIMLSDGWRQKMGQSPREPFTRMYKSPFLADSIPDEILAQLVREMTRAGLNDLHDTSLDRINLEAYKRAERLPESAQEEIAKLRLINIETESMKKSITYGDNIGSLEEAQRFVKVEREVIKIAYAYTVQITIESAPAVPK